MEECALSTGINSGNITHLDQCSQKVLLIVIYTVVYLTRFIFYFCVNLDACHISLAPISYYRCTLIMSNIY